MKRIHFVLVLAIAFFAIAVPVFAQVNVNYIQPTTFALKSADLESTVIKIVQWVLQLLGLIAVIMIIAAVFIGATSSDADRAAKARTALIGAIIGLVIVLLAWAIVTFVVKAALNVTS